MDVVKFKEKAIEKYGSKYDYSGIQDISHDRKLKIRCPEHGAFFQKARVHLNTNCKGCPQCSYEKISIDRMTDAVKFLTKVNKVHHNKYTYRMAGKIAMRDTISIECPEHGLFYQTAAIHQKGSGCPECGRIKMSNTKRHSHGRWLAKAKEKHGERFDYSKTRYEGRKVNILVRCIKHDLEFEQNPHNHLNKPHCCPMCEREAIRSDRGEFIKKANRKHHNRYDYSLVEYVDALTKVQISCSQHGAFWQSPGNHLYSTGCPGCRESHGERRIAGFLDRHNLQYERNKTYSDLTHKAFLSYDFYVAQLNMLIEFDGEQHFRPIEHFGGVKAFRAQVVKDQKKNVYAESNGINLLRIKFNELDNIETKLQYFISNRFGLALKHGNLLPEFQNYSCTAFGESVQKI